MEIFVIALAGSVCVATVGVIILCCYLFAPKYEHRNSFIGESDIKHASRFEKLWNKRQDEIEAANLAPHCSCDVPCKFHPNSKIGLNCHWQPEEGVHRTCPIHSV